MGALSLDELRADIDRGAVDTVLLALVDMPGRLKGKRFDARHFIDRVVPEGAGMCAYVLATDVDMRPVDGFSLASWDTGYGDMRLTPDPRAVHRLPWWPGTALVHADADLDGRPVPVSPRRLLRERLARLAEHGLTAGVGLETEFVLYRGRYADVADGRLPEPVAPRNRDCALDHDPLTDRFLRALHRGLREAGLPLEAAKTEGAAGQVEITFPYGDALAACDGHTVFKHGARVLGERLGTVPSFMAAPATGVASGLHLHLSLWREGRPVLADADGSPTALAAHAVAGLLTALPELAPLYAPTVNSYKRYVERSFAPTRFSWGVDNRTCAVRIAGRGPGRHLEIRLPGADANPYLALTAALAAIEHGIDHRLKPPPPCVGDGYREEAGPPVPRTLAAAAEALGTGPLARELLGPAVAGHYAHAARVEAEALAGSAGLGAEVSDAERERWFGRA
ncbi:glutamine synthetase family protein [Streptomyces sp. SAJ15]|uniref:glutamine synthetase family protein n=1 Tax=Streptomyces sp. SAJ15 TaxID=2011095 RepID=UPI0011869E5B|nr:glutamine synthetase family protein [Streptomyces sp. SAJ15]TVL94224.1 glutamine synthetase [Streptomyces sp. SAJ15]